MLRNNNENENSKNEIQDELKQEEKLIEGKQEEKKIEDLQKSIIAQIKGHISSVFEQLKVRIAGEADEHKWPELDGQLFRSTPEFGDSLISKRIQEEINNALSNAMIYPDSKTAAQFIIQNARTHTPDMHKQVMTWCETQRREMECIYQTKIFLDDDFKKAEASAKDSENWEQKFFDGDNIGDYEKISRELQGFCRTWDINFSKDGERLSDEQYQNIVKLFTQQIEEKREKISSCYNHNMYIRNNNQNENKIQDELKQEEKLIEHQNDNKLDFKADTYSESVESSLEKSANFSPDSEIETQDEIQEMRIISEIGQIKRTIINGIIESEISPMFEDFKRKIINQDADWKELSRTLFDHSSELGENIISEKIQNKIADYLKRLQNTISQPVFMNFELNIERHAPNMLRKIENSVSEQREEMEGIYQTKLFLDNYFKQAEASAKNVENWEQDFFDNSQVGDNMKINIELIKFITESNFNTPIFDVRLSQKQYESIWKLFQAQIEEKRNKINHHTRFRDAQAFFVGKAKGKGKVDEDEPLKDFSPKIEKRAESFSNLSTFWKSKEPVQKQEECAQEENATPSVVLK